MDTTDTGGALKYTGERMVPGAAEELIFWEHVERYRFAGGLVRDKEVLDIACGEGYGSAALLRAGAASLVGVDISSEAVEHARAKYHVDARVGSAEEIPLPDKSQDLVVSFETIEHVPQPELFLDECVRVLRPGGTLVISTPNLDIYRVGTPNNPFHCSEMDVRHFERILKVRFEQVSLFGQTPPDSVFLRQRGLGRFIKMVRGIFLPARTRPLGETTRQRVVELCAQPLNPIQRFLSPNAVRAMPAAQLEKCCYIVAVATAPRPR